MLSAVESFNQQTKAKWTEKKTEDKSTQYFSGPISARTRIHYFPAAKQSAAPPPAVDTPV